MTGCPLAKSASSVTYGDRKRNGRVRDDMLCLIVSILLIIICNLRLITEIQF